MLLLADDDKVYTLFIFIILNIFDVTYYPFNNIFVKSCLFIIPFMFEGQAFLKLLLINVKRCDDKVKRYNPKDNSNEIEV